MSPMTWEQHVMGEEQAAMGQAMAEHLQALLDHEDARDFRDLNRDLYKYTDCGAYLTLRLWDGAPVWSHDTRLPTIKVGDVASIGVGSIVEGTDMAPEDEWLDLLTYAEDEDASRLISDWGAAVQRIEDAAHDIWMETHGCESCGPLNEYGYRSVDPDCPKCDGDGIII